jgi:hypothetical protein
MPRWLRVIRGMIGTGLTFTVGGGVVGLLFGVPMWLFNEISGLDLIAITGKFAVVAFPVGVAFSGVLALTARGLTLEKLSLPRVAGLGAGAGLLYFALIGVNAFRVWSVADALGNLAVLTLMGGGSATAILLLARRAGPARAYPPPGLRGSSPELSLASGRTPAGSIGAAVGEAEGILDPPHRVEEGARRRRG